MMSIVRIMCVMLVFLGFASGGYAEVIRLKADSVDGCIGVSSFLTNNQGEIFLYSRGVSKVFKFKPNGDFEKSFCQIGEGPGDIKRVLYIFHNPKDNFLYLPEHASNHPKISVFDSQGNFIKYMDIELSRSDLDSVVKLMFLEDGSFYTNLNKRIDWEPYGDLFITKDQFTVLYFSKEGKLKGNVYKTFQDGEMSNGRGWGGPRVFFQPAIITRHTPEGNILIGKNDEPTIQEYDQTGKLLKTYKLPLEKVLLSDEEFQKSRDAGIKFIENRDRDARMLLLVKNMKKLEYKPIYNSFFYFSPYIVVSNVKRETSLGATFQSTIDFYDKSCQKVASKDIQGYVVAISKNKFHIILTDDDDNESYVLEDFSLPSLK